jgi:hypothetical protein
MNSRSAKFSWTVEIRYWVWLAFGVLCLACLGCASLLTAGELHTAPDLKVHEWGTFTAIAGNNGRALQWQTLQGATDLPEFVEHFQHR